MSASGGGNSAGLKTKGPSVLDLRKTDQFYYELFKGLRAKVEYKIDVADLRVLGVTSAVAGEGKTLTAVNLAANMAMTGRKKVLLLDMDLRKSSIAEELSIAPRPGLGDFLLNAAPTAEIFRNSILPGLTVVPCGKTISSPADLLAGEKFRALLRELRAKFDLVILDTPPVLPVPDALTISEQVDAFILLFRLAHTPQQMFRQAVEEIGERKILGVVLNGEAPRSNRYYSKYYGKYYHGVRVEGEHR
jgi:capsular exopolysaccharide synthesis family protein